MYRFRRRRYFSNRYKWNGGCSNLRRPSSLQQRGMILKRSPNVSQSGKNHFSAKDLQRYYDWLLKNNVVHLPGGLSEITFYELLDVAFPHPTPLQGPYTCSREFDDLYPMFNERAIQAFGHPSLNCHWDFIVLGFGLRFNSSDEPYEGGWQFLLGYSNDAFVNSGGALNGVKLCEPAINNVPYIAPDENQNLFFNLCALGAQTSAIQSFQQSGQSPFDFNFERKNPEISDEFQPFDEGSKGFTPLMYSIDSVAGYIPSGVFHVVYSDGYPNKTPEDHAEVEVCFSLHCFEVRDPGWA